MELTGDAVSISTIWRALRSQNLTQKTVRVCLYQNQFLMAIQITKVAKERDEMKRAEYSQWIAQYLPEERVYVDESRFDNWTAT